MNKKAILDLVVDQGRDFRQWLGWREDDEETINPDGTKGTYTDLTGYTFKAQVREAPAHDAELIIEFTIDTSDQLTTSDIYLTLTDAQVLGLQGIVGHWDLLATSPDGIDETWAKGLVTFEGQPTKKGA